MTTEKPRLAIWFSDFGSSRDKLPLEVRFFRSLFDRCFSVTLDSTSPNILFYSSYGMNFLKYRCRRIFFSAENRKPDFAECDFALTCAPDGGRNLCLPYYVIASGDDLPALCAPRDGVRIARSKTRFCNFIYSHIRGCERNLFFRILHAQKPVDAAGELYNNTPAPSPHFSANWREAKIEFMRDYKFSIAFENESWPGYTTEKITDAFLAGTVPIYYGNPKITDDFNPEAFINCHDFHRWEDVVERVLQIAADDSLLARYLSAPPFVHNRLPACADRDQFGARLADFVTAPLPHLATDGAYVRWQRFAPRASVAKVRSIRMARGRALPCPLTAPTESIPAPPMLPHMADKSMRAMRTIAKWLLRQREYPALRDCLSRWQPKKSRDRVVIFLWLCWWSLTKNRLDFWK